MKKLATLSLLAAGALALAPKPAMAGDGDKALAALGGFIGGLIVGSNANSSHHSTVVYAPPCPPPPPVVVIDDGYGYWRSNSVRVWIAPSWVVVYDHWNRPTRRYVAGHYEIRKHRVWVADNRKHNRYYHNDYDGHDHRDGHRSDHRKHDSDRHDRH